GLVPANLRVIMGVGVNKTWSYNQIRSVDHLPSTLCDFTYSGNLSFRNRHIGVTGRGARTVDPRAIFNQQLVVRHENPPLARVSRSMWYYTEGYVPRNEPDQTAHS